MMDAFAARVSRLQRAAWGLRAAGGRAGGLPFALALMTDERSHPDIVSLIERLSGAPPVLIVFRHYGLAPDARRALARAACEVARAGGHPFVVAGGGMPADGAHNAGHAGLRTASVHGLGEAVEKQGFRPHLALVSPVLPTASHPGTPALGPARAAAIAARLPVPAFALGGMDAHAGVRLRGTPFSGLAVLSALRT